MSDIKKSASILNFKLGINISALKMEAACSFKTSVSTYEITQSQNAEDHNLTSSCNHHHTPHTTPTATPPPQKKRCKSYKQGMDCEN
jgi:hypothetical protein